MSKIDINTILQSQIWDISSKTFNGVRVLDMNLRQLEQICRLYGFTKFLTESKGQVKLAKTAKELGIYSIGISISPYTLGRLEDDLSNIIDVCTNATTSCKQSCVIQFGGNPAYLDGKQRAMLGRKRMLADDPTLFLAVALRYIELKSDKCIRDGIAMTCRLNISSDIIWEKVICHMGYWGTCFSNLVYHLCARTSNGDIIPYDYTKHFDRHRDVHYHKVYSVTDHDVSKAETAIANGMPLAVVFDTPRNRDLPTEYTIGKFTLPVYDGDKHDYTPIHGRDTHIVGLRFKHQAKHNKAQREAVLSKHILSGFVKMAG